MHAQYRPVRFSGTHSTKRHLLGNRAGHAPPAWRNHGVAVPAPGGANNGNFMMNGKGKETGSKILLSRLPVDVGDKEVEELFKKTVGPLKDAFLIYNSQGNSKGMAVVTFQRPGDAAIARAKYDGKIVDGRRPLKIEIVYDGTPTEVAAAAVPAQRSLLNRIGQVAGEPKTAAVAKVVALPTPQPLRIAPVVVAPLPPRRIRQKKGPKRLKKRLAGYTAHQPHRPASKEDLDKEMDDCVATSSCYLHQVTFLSKRVQLPLPPAFTAPKMVAPLYTTASGLLFHAGKILILTVGLPARGKTHISRALERYLRWMGIKTQVISLGDYRRKTLGGAQKLPKDYFTPGEKSPETLTLRKTVAEGCEKLIWSFFDAGGQVVIYDANNGTRAQRQVYAERFHSKGIHVIYLESLCDNKEIIETNIRNVKISSPDYRNWDPDKAVEDYYKRIMEHEKYYQTVEETEWPFIRIINVGEKIEVNNIQGYLQSRIVFFLMNIHNRYRTIYFARSGQSLLEHSYKADSDLSPVGWNYAEKLAEFVLERRTKNLEARGLNPAERRLVIWTSTRRRAHHTAWPFLAAAQTSIASTSVPTPAEPPAASGSALGPIHYPMPATSSNAPARPSPLWRSTVVSPEPTSSTMSQLAVDTTTSLMASLTALSHPATPPSPFSSPPLPPLASANPAAVASPLIQVKVVEKPQMLEINPGIWDGLTPGLAKKYYPGDWDRFVKDPYSYRVPRAESYHDLSVRLEPVLIELEREQEDLLIIGHASVIRCLLAYLIGLPASEIPAIEVARGDLLEVVPTSYGVVSQAYHFWDGPGRIEEDGDDVDEHTEDEEASPEGVMRKVERLRHGYRDVNNFYENYAEDTKGKRLQPNQIVAGDGTVGIANAEMDTVLRAVGGISVQGSEMKKDLDVAEQVLEDGGT
ncbi:hypothetical protein APHAL10511_004983 [Amanita phalloides]|nr:hypothetical protein APHAL10511_004983 [Amanita phalloides]